MSTQLFDAPVVFLFLCVYVLEATLVNRATFARLQLSRIIARELHIFDGNEKKRVANDSYQELMQSMSLLEKWGTKTATEVHDDLLEEYEKARDLMNRVGPRHHGMMKTKTKPLH